MCGCKRGWKIKVSLMTVIKSFSVHFYNFGFESAIFLLFVILYKYFFLSSIALCYILSCICYRVKNNNALEIKIMSLLVEVHMICEVLGVTGRMKWVYIIRIGKKNTAFQ